MISQCKTFGLATLLLMASFSAAQTFSDCNPMKDKGCPDRPAFGPVEHKTDFTQGQAAMADWKATMGSLNFQPQGAEFKISKLGEGPTIQSNSYLFYGYVEVVLQAAPGAGIISSIVLQSDDLDEIDWEWIGSEQTRGQTNFFGKGNTTTYDRVGFQDIKSPQTMFHTYAVNWTKEATTWYVDGTPVRTVRFGDALALGGKNYPQTPMNLRIGNWVAGTPGNAKGTIEWAGGLADFSKGPFSMFVKSVKIINYNPGESYRYTDSTGDSSSIKVINPAMPGQISGGDTKDGGLRPSPGASTNNNNKGSGKGGLNSTDSVGVRGPPKPTCSTHSKLPPATSVNSQASSAATVSLNLATPAASGYVIPPSNGGLVAAQSPDNSQPSQAVVTINVAGNGGNQAVAVTSLTSADTMDTSAISYTTSAALAGPSPIASGSGTLFGLGSGTPTGSGPPAVFTGAAVHTVEGQHLKAAFAAVVGTILLAF